MNFALILFLGLILLRAFQQKLTRCLRIVCGLVEECGLTFLHVFPFSPRPGTPAALMPQVKKAVIKERAAKIAGAWE